MSLSRQSYVVDAGTAFTVAFPFIERDDVHVTLDAEEVAFSWIADTVIEIPTAQAGQVVVIWRETKRDQMYVDFSVKLPGQLDLDLNARQTFYAIQEAFDGATGGLSLNLNNQFDAQGRNIRNLADPLLAADAATRGWCLSFADGQMAKAKGFAEEARASYLAALDQKNVVAGMYNQLMGLNAYIQDIQSEVDEVIAAKVAAESARNVAQGYRDECLEAKTVAIQVELNQSALSAQISAFAAQAASTKVELDGHLDAVELAATAAGATAIDAKDDAVAAQAAAEAARDLAETYRDEAEVIRNSLSSSTFGSVFEIDLNGDLMPLVSFPPDNPVFELDVNDDITPIEAP